MQPAKADTVLGDFKDANFHKDAVTSSFYRQDGQVINDMDAIAHAKRSRSGLSITRDHVEKMT
jgi:hypothetical protein